MPRVSAIARGSSLGVLAFALALAASAPVDASAFTVNPTQIMLSAAAPSTVLTIRNDSEATLRFQLTTVEWAQTPDGEMQLTSTDDLVVFPLLMTLKPNEERRIRIGAGKPMLDVLTEKTYRLFVEELPAAAAEDNPGAVKVLTRMGIPVFIRPPTPRAAAAVEALSVASGDISFRIVNRGNAHMLPKGVTVRELGEADAPLHHEALSPWYILAGGVRDYRLRVNPASCSHARTVVAEVQIGDTVLSERVTVQPPRCGR